MHEDFDRGDQPGGRHVGQPPAVGPAGAHQPGIGPVRPGRFRGRVAAAWTRCVSRSWGRGGQNPAASAMPLRHGYPLLGPPGCPGHRARISAPRHCRSPQAGRRVRAGGAVHRKRPVPAGSACWRALRCGDHLRGGALLAARPPGLGAPDPGLAETRGAVPPLRIPPLRLRLRRWAPPRTIPPSTIPTSPIGLPCVSTTRAVMPSRTIPLRTVSHEWSHPLSEVVSALCDAAGLRIHFLHEFPFTTYAGPAHAGAARGPRWVWPGRQSQHVPLTYSIRATAPEDGE
jgi:hypothetical protein